MVAGISLAAFLPNTGGEADPEDLPTAPAAEETVATEPEEEDEPSDVIVRNYPAADFVIEPDLELYTATISTSKGDIVIELFADDAPNTVNSFVFLAENRFFDGLVFHRVVDNFVVQGGSPTNTSVGGPGYITGDEPNEIRNETGTIAMAKGAGQPYFGSQFFINLKHNIALDFDTDRGDRFYPFGRVIEGMEVVNAIVEGDVMESVTITRAPNPDAPTPEAEEGAEGDEEGEADPEAGDDGEDAGDEDAGN
ncbi:MAG: peptidylprolyl isomerase [Dehalococcoidia bacterium]|nr:peptidylprolyl isomerase [Dehalococcoidia bacterium]